MHAGRLTRARRYAQLGLERTGPSHTERLSGVVANLISKPQIGLEPFAGIERLPNLCDTVPQIGKQQEMSSQYVKETIAERYFVLALKAPYVVSSYEPRWAGPDSGRTVWCSHKVGVIALQIR